MANLQEENTLMRQGNGKGKHVRKLDMSLQSIRMTYFCLNRFGFSPVEPSESLIFNVHDLGEASGYPKEQSIAVVKHGMK